MQIILKQIKKYNGTLKYTINDRNITFYNFLRILSYASMKNWKIQHNIHFSELENEHIYYISNK